jgi:hypothetical protein
MTGANRVAKAAPDGYQFVLGNVGTHAQNQTLYKRPAYNAVTDFAPVVLITDQSLVLIARKDFPANNLQEFIAYAKANQVNMRYSSAGVGGSNHLACVLLNSAIGINVTHVPYRSGGQAMQDLLAGRVDYQCPSAHAADRRQEREGVGSSEQEAFDQHAGPAVCARARTDGLRHPELVCPVPAERYPGCDCAQSQQRRARRHGYAVDAAAAQGDRL